MSFNDATGSDRAAELLRKYAYLEEQSREYVNQYGSEQGDLNAGRVSDDYETQLQAELVLKSQQVETISSELESVTVRALDDAGRYAEILGGRDAAARSSQKHISELRKRLREQEGRIGNLEDSIDALSGRLESEINRAEKLQAQNQSMRELLDKQAKAMSYSGDDEARSATAAANAKCYALENKVAGLEADHRTAQRKLARLMEKKIKEMEDTRFKLEAKVEKLVHANKRLLLIIDGVKSTAQTSGLMLPELDGVQAADFLTTLDDIPPPTTTTPRSPRVVGSQDMNSERVPSNTRPRRRRSGEMRDILETTTTRHSGSSAMPDEDDDTGELKAANRHPSPVRNSRHSSSTTSTGGRKKSPSPSPFRRFIGRRAKSPGRSLSKDHAVASVGGSSSKPSSTRNSRRGMGFGKLISHASQDDVAPMPAPQEVDEDIQPPPVNEAAPSRNMKKKRRASLSALASRTLKGSAPKQEVPEPDEPPPVPEPNRQQQAAERRGAAAQKHAARMRAVRNNPKGSWGFSV